MPLPLISEFDIAREFRLQQRPGSAVDAITNPAVRRALEAGARARAARESREFTRSVVDAKSRAANDFD